MDKHTKEWLDKQPLWSDFDLFAAGCAGVIIGFIIGLIV